MPSRNVLKQDVAGGYYHIYSRGVDKRKIFIKAKDYAVFLNLLKRYLSVEPQKDKNGVLYPHLYNKLEIQNEKGAMQKLMRAVLTSYSRYFNRTYHRRGPLFESRYKASLISDQSYLEHISRYIHLNPNNWQRYSYSSLPYFLYELSAEWVKPKKILDMFGLSGEYLKFMEDYQDHKKMLEEVKSELADR